ncbi:McrC family protein [Halomicrobium urmianum]|uniref:McrC family protein n=1 Tax=Halomicrobium urmianum TaxID=1586233 RepID=UPI001CD9C0E7|nr:McrC family protein [Halomicrobium urmianum]
MTVTHDTVQSAESSADWVLREYQETDPLTEDELTPRDRNVIANEINDDSDRISMVWLPDGRVKLRATQYVGILTLPSGLTIEVKPKVPETSLLEMLQYSQGIQADTIAEETSITAGREFIRALATLFETELSDVLQRGLVKEYRERSDTEEHIRGRLDVHRQLQRQGPQPTQFECTYDELTTDTVLNQSLLYATTVLLRLLEDGRVSAALQRHQQILQRQVTFRPVRTAELEYIELSRLANHYEDIFRLMKLILQGVYVENLQTGESPSFSLLVNMNDIFEGVIERVFEDLFAGSSMRVQGQYSSTDLVEEGYRPIRIRPDIVVKDGTDVVFVGDAKWKEDESNDREPSNDDIYQLISYQVAHDVPGALFYPSQEADIGSTYSSSLDHQLYLVEIPTTSTVGERYPETVMRSLRESLPTTVWSRDSNGAQ